MFETLQYFSKQEEIVFDTKSRYLILVAEKSDFDASKIPQKTPFVGAVFPRVVFETKSYDKGFIVARMSANTSGIIVKDMDEEINIPGIDRLTALMVLVDGLSSKISDFLYELFETIQAKCQIIGAGAGKLTLKQEPIIFSNSGFFKNAALIIGSYDPLSLGLSHGWKELEGPLIATKTDRNILKKINYEDAYKVYKDIVEEDSGVTMTEDNFFSLAKSYPIGIVRYSKDFIVRDPIITNGHNLVLVGEIENNSIISLLKGDKKGLTKAANEAAREAKEHYKGTKLSHSFLIDCISRYLFLGEEFSEELLAIKEQMPKDVPLWGVLSLGEIANANMENIEFYNKTCVVGVF